MDAPKKDKLLFTPGPLTTSATVKAAMMHDVGSRDVDFIRIVKEVREKLKLIGCTPEQAREFETVIIQGSGTFSVESVLTSAVPDTGKVLVLANGSYGKRMGQICATARIPHRLEWFGEADLVGVERTRALLEEDAAITHVAVVHSETTSGAINPVAELGRLARERGKVFIVDAMSSYGAVPIDLVDAGVDFIVSSANKCVEGVPGFGYVVARRAALLQATHARSLSLDLLSQWKGLEANGQFRFTPATHALLAFRQALAELEAEGGVAARAARYRENCRVVLEGMAALGFEPYLPAEKRGYIINSFRFPRPGWDFERFYSALSARGFVLYPGKVTDADSFRVGCIGHLFPDDCRAMVAAAREVMAEMGEARNGH